MLTFLHTTLAHTGAHYLFLCPGQKYVAGESFAERVDAGERVDWLQEVPEFDPALLVIRVRAGAH